MMHIMAIISPWRPWAENIRPAATVLCSLACLLVLHGYKLECGHTAVVLLGLLHLNRCVHSRVHETTCCELELYECYFKFLDHKHTNTWNDSSLWPVFSRVSNPEAVVLEILIRPWIHYACAVIKITGPSELLTSLQTCLFVLQGNWNLTSCPFVQILLKYFSVSISDGLL